MTTNQASSYFHKIDRNRLQIADSDCTYIGSINSYNNAITRFVAGIFNLSMTININDETRHVNINSYEKFLKKYATKLSDDNQKLEVGSYINFSETMEEYGTKEKWANNGEMRQYLSHSERRRLDEKLAKLVRKLCLFFWVEIKSSL